MNATFDLTPLTRSIIGFDRFNNLIDKAFSDVKVPAYPPYNIEKLSDTEYAIVMAVAGFRQGDLEITSQDNMLKVSGRITEESEEKEKNYLHRGIATRSFERVFNLDDHVKVKGAELKDGLLHIDLVREVPEESKPKMIEIKSASSGTSKQKTIEGKKTH